MTIKTIENSMIEKLNTDITDLKIEGYPDKPETYRLNHPKGAILINYFGSDFGKPMLREELESFIVQEEDELFRCIVSVRGLRDHQGVYDYIDRIKASLMGYHPVDSLRCKKMYVKQIRFVSEEDGVWTYAMLFAVKLLTQESDE